LAIALLPKPQYTHPWTLENLKVYAQDGHVASSHSAVLVILVTGMRVGINPPRFSSAMILANMLRYHQKD
jgi:acid phosphatase family membrane protein YuiD